MSQSDPWNDLKNLRRNGLIFGFSWLPFGLLVLLAQHRFPGWYWIPVLIVGYVALFLALRLHARESLCPRCGLEFFPKRDRSEDLQRVRRSKWQFGNSWRCDYCDAQLGDSIEISEHDRGVLHKRAKRSLYE